MQELIQIEQICKHYQVDTVFLFDLDDVGLIRLKSSDQTHFIHVDEISRLEQIIRIKTDLNVNIEGIDVIFNLMKKIESLEEALYKAKCQIACHEMG